MSNRKKTEGSKSKMKMYIPVALITLIVVVGAVYWYMDYSKYISTDDAKIESDNVGITPKMMGRIVKIHKNEEDVVTMGELLVELDSTDLMAQLAQAVAVKEQALANKAQLVAKYNFDLESTQVQKINYEKTKDDLKRAQTQFDNQVITKEQFEHIQKANESAKAQSDASGKMLQVSKAQIDAAIASIQTAEAQINIIRTQLQNTRLYAPLDGTVAKKWLLPGDVVSPGQSVLTLCERNKARVAIYLEETKIAEVYQGQDVVFTLDAYPDITFFGKVYQIGSNTAAQFSLIPASNASGNFTKVTQRIPVKISIDKVSGDKKLEEYELFNGMSAVVKLVKG